MGPSDPSPPGRAPSPDRPQSPDTAKSPDRPQSQDGTQPVDEALPQVGVRELRNQVAALLRQAAAGDRVVVTVDGRPTAQLGPVAPPPGRLTVDDLIAAGLAQPPVRSDRPPAPPPEDVPVDVRPGTVLDELRGNR